MKSIKTILALLLAMTLVLGTAGTVLAEEEECPQPVCIYDGEDWSDWVYDFTETENGLLLKQDLELNKELPENEAGPNEVSFALSADSFNSETPSVITVDGNVILTVEIVDAETDEPVVPDESGENGGSPDIPSPEEPDPEETAASAVAVIAQSGGDGGKTDVHITGNAVADVTNKDGDACATAVYAESGAIPEEYPDSTPSETNVTVDGKAIATAAAGEGCSATETAVDALSSGKGSSTTVTIGEVRRGRSAQQQVMKVRLKSQSRMAASPQTAARFRLTMTERLSQI